MLKNLAQLEHVVSGKAYQFVCAVDAPIQDVKDALFQFLKYVGNIEDQAKAQAAAAAPAPAPEAPEVPVVASVAEAPVEQPKE